MLRGHLRLRRGFPAGSTMIRCLFCLLLLASSGCQQTRSFLHMNSDNPSPFLGLQFSVDAGHKLDRDASIRTVSLAKSEGPAPRADEVVSLDQHFPLNIQLDRDEGRDHDASDQPASGGKVSDRLPYSLTVVNLQEATTSVTLQAEEMVSRLGGDIASR